MKLRSLPLLLAALVFSARTPAVEDSPQKTPPAAEPEQKPPTNTEPEQKPPNAHEMLNALIRAEAAKKQAAANGTAPPPPAAIAPATKPKDDAATAATNADKAKAEKSEAAPDAKAAKPKDELATAKQDPASVLPKVEVNQSRITEINRQIYEQDKAIAQEKQLTKPSDLDKALNNSKVSKALSIFGGESSDHRAGIAGERVRIMQEEKELLEAIKQAKTKEEKTDLQKQLDELRAYRRELEKSLR